MKKLLTSIDLQDVQLVSGITLLGYGLYLVYPPSAFIVIGLMLILPIVLPSIIAVWRGK